jgi:hypothetical protein
MTARILNPLFLLFALQVAFSRRLPPSISQRQENSGGTGAAFAFSVPFQLPGDESLPVYLYPLARKLYKVRPQ